MEYNKENISKFYEGKKRLHVFSKIIFFFIIIVLFLCAVIFKKLDNTTKDNKINGIQGLVVITGSMEPTININDVVIIKSTEFNRLQKGDIITFYRNNEIITHRIIDIDYGKEILYTKGDNNENIDWDEVGKNDIYGKVIYIVPKIGTLVLKLQNGKKYYISVIIIIFLIYFFIEYKEKKKEKRKKSRRKYELKKAREKYDEK